MCQEYETKITAVAGKDYAGASEVCVPMVMLIISMVSVKVLVGGYLLGRMLCELMQSPICRGESRGPQGEFY